MGAFDGELYSLGYRFNSSKDEPTKPKEERLPAVSKYTLLELLKKHNIQIPKRFGSGNWKYYRKELHFIKDLGYVKVSLNTKDADGIIRIMCYECQKKILED